MQQQSKRISGAGIRLSTRLKTTNNKKLPTPTIVVGQWIFQNVSKDKDLFS